MNFQEFQANYRINAVRAVEYAQIFGVTFAQIQLWIVRIVKGN